MEIEMQRQRIQLVIILVVSFGLLHTAWGAQRIGQLEFEQNFSDPYGFISVENLRYATFVNGITGDAIRSSHAGDDGSGTDDCCVQFPTNYWPTSNELYIRFYYKFEADYINQSGNIKWLWTFGSNGHNEAIISSINGSNSHAYWQLGGEGASWPGGKNAIYNDYVNIPTGEWLFVEFYIKLSSGDDHLNPDGQQWWKINGNYVFHETGVKTGFPGRLYSPAINASRNQSSGHGWWQIDNYEVWDGLPGQEYSEPIETPNTPVTPPTTQPPSSASQKVCNIDFENNLNDSLGGCQEEEANACGSAENIVTYVPGHTGYAARSSHMGSWWLDGETCNIPAADDGGDDFTVKIPTTTWINSGELYIKYWVKYEAEYFDPDFYNTKLFWSDNGSEIIISSFGSSTFNMYWERAGWDCGSRGAVYADNIPYRRGDWMKIEFYLKLSTGAGHDNCDGVGWVKINDNQVIYDDDLRTGSYGTIWSPAIKADCGAGECVSGHSWWQIDDFEVWTGLPNADSNPDSAISVPRNFRKISNSNTSSTNTKVN